MTIAKVSVNAAFEIDVRNSNVSFDQHVNQRGILGIGNCSALRFLDQKSVGADGHFGILSVTQCPVEFVCVVLFQVIICFVVPQDPDVIPRAMEELSRHILSFNIVMMEDARSTWTRVANDRRFFTAPSAIGERTFRMKDTLGQTEFRLVEDLQHAQTAFLVNRVSLTGVSSNISMTLGGMADVGRSKNRL